MNKINGTIFPDFLIGTPEADRIKGFGGNDNLFGLGDDDELLGGSGNDLNIRSVQPSAALA